jgi:hypothetical protein
LEVGADSIVASDTFPFLIDALQSFRNADAAFCSDFVNTIGKLVNRCETLASVVVARLLEPAQVLNRLCPSPGVEN